ncbi:MAG TPA: DNA cytosine methyltransferase [Nitrosospira sp.]|nr:DNA cytosine methyltransferase [Nitrosospira sp.]
MTKKIAGTSPLVAVDLFAGAGGFSLAAVQSGFTINFAIENDKFAIQTYKNNILKMIECKDAVVFEKNILEYDPVKIKKDRFKYKSCDLLLGGPPCQGFSTHRILDAGVDDPRNELILAYFRFVKALQPKVFLMENVPGILWPRHKSYLSEFYEQARLAGYTLFPPATLDARDFGVPQRRKRVFILGLRNDVEVGDFAWPPPPTHCNPEKAEIGDTLWKSCAHVFDTAPTGDANNIHMHHGSDLTKAFQNTPINGGSRKDSGRTLKCHESHDGHKDVYGRIDPNQPAPTMTTACINPSKGRFVHPTEHHGITVRQAARIQTFPDAFKFVGGITAAGRQVGNAVPIALGKYLITYVKALLQPMQSDPLIRGDQMGSSDQECELV